MVGGRKRGVVATRREIYFESGLCTQTFDRDVRMLDFTPLQMLAFSIIFAKTGTVSGLIQLALAWYIRAW